MAYRFLVNLFFIALIFLWEQGFAEVSLKATQRYSSFRDSRCLNIFLKTGKKDSSQETKFLSEFKFRAQDFTPDGEWWFVSKEIQKHLDEARTLPELIEKLKNLGSQSKKIRKERELDEFESWDVFYNIFVSVDYIQPLLKYKNEISIAQKDEILRHLSQILDLPLTQRKKTSFAAFYNQETLWESRYTNLMMFEAFLNPQRMDHFLTGILESTGGLASGVSRGPERSGWGYVNPSLVTLLATLDATTATQMIVKVRSFIEENKALDKDMSLDAETRDRASNLRRNGEVLLNLLFYSETIHLIETLKSNSNNKTEALKKMDQLLELKNGYKAEMDMATLRLVAKEISLALSDLALSGDTYIVGSALSGRFKKSSSDIDLIFSFETQEYFKNAFKAGYHGLILFNKPLSESSREASKRLLQMQTKVHQILKNRAKPNIFSSSGVSILASHYTYEQQRDMILFGFSALSNNFSIRMNNGKIFLGIYDPLTYTNYELDITNL